MTAPSIFKYHMQGKTGFMVFSEFSFLCVELGIW